MSQVFFRLFRKLMRTKTQQSTDKALDIMGVHYFRAYNQVEPTFSFIFYPIFILLPCYLRQPPLSSPPPTPTPGPGQTYKRVIPHQTWPLMKTLPPPILSTDHHASGNEYVVAPAAASNKSLPSPQLWRFVSIDTAVVDDDHQSRPIRCRLC